LQRVLINHLARGGVHGENRSGKIPPLFKKPRASDTVHRPLNVEIIEKSCLSAQRAKLKSFG